MAETQTAKIGISTNADDVLTKCLDKVNDGFLGGRVTKASLASWLITNGAEHLTTENIHDIRQADFKQVLYLEGLARRLKASGQDSLSEKELEELRKLFVGKKVDKSKKKVQCSESTRELKDQGAA